MTIKHRVLLIRLRFIKNVILELLIRRLFTPGIILRQLPIVLSRKIECLTTKVNSKPRDEFEDLLPFTDHFSLDKVIRNRLKRRDKELEVRSLTFSKFPTNSFRYSFAYKGRSCAWNKSFISPHNLTQLFSSNPPRFLIAIRVSSAQYAGNFTDFWASVYPISSHSSSHLLRNSLTFVLSKNKAPASPGRGIRK